jgi:anti-anti-sigma regulatory factor
MSLDVFRRATHTGRRAAFAAASPMSSDRPLLRIEVDQCTMRLDGELDRSTVPLLQRGACGTRRIDRIDLGGLTFIDVAGVRALVAVRRWNPGIAIVGATAAALRVMQLVGVLDVLRPMPDVGPDQGARPGIHRGQPPTAASPARPRSRRVDVTVTREAPCTPSRS